MIDSGIASAYGGHVAYLEITPEGLFAGYPDGKLPLPSSDEGSIAYLEQVIAMKPDNPYLRQRLEKLLRPAAPEPPEETAAEGVEAAPEAESRPIPICGISE
jgi:hypothetical protein